MTRTAIAPAPQGTVPSAEPRPSALPDPSRLAAWLWHDAVAEHGQVWSWRNEPLTGFPYPEAGGLWLSAACCQATAPERPTADQLDAVASWLCDSVAAGDIGKDGRQYAFDASVVLCGLLRYEETGGAVAVTATSDTLFRYIARCIERGETTTPPTTEGEPRWSLRFGPHLLKAGLSLNLYGRARGAGSVTPLCERLVTQLVPLFDGCRFRTSGSSGSYHHAACYGLEGLAVLETLHPAFSALLRQGLDWLAHIQASDGALPTYSDGQTTWGPCQADVASQATRLWLLVDRERYAANIEGALAFLARLQTSAGALRYSTECADQNTWATAFALQAVRWWQSGGTALEIW